MASARPNPVGARRVSDRGRVTYFDPTEPHAVYRVFDGSGLLLYIGMSADPERRVKAHRSSAPWRREIARWSAEWHPNRAAAGRVEQAAIDSEMPCYGMTTDLYREVSRIAASTGWERRRAAVGTARERYRRQAIEWQTRKRSCVAL